MSAPHNTADVYPETQLTPYTLQHFPVNLIYGCGNACLSFETRAAQKSCLTKPQRKKSGGGKSYD